MRVAVLQLPSIGMSSTKLFNYVRIAQKKGVKVLLLGEGVLAPFFKELEQMPMAMIREQADHHTKVLRDLAQTYAMTIVAPMVVVKKSKPYKAIVKFAPHSTSYYYQQLLINYSHWHEEKFFSNEIAPIKPPFTFKVDGFKFMLMGGFELHFDLMFESIAKKNVDAVLLPSVATFESGARWQELIKMRAFTHNCYILRANRIGEFSSEDGSWNFYGDSILANPFGEVEAHLGNSEELMICDLNKKVLREARRSWGFKDALSKRDKES